MSIYPDRKNGQLTGRFAVEVQSKGQRLRGRANTLAEAKALEAAFEAKFAAGYVPENAKRKFTPSHSRPQSLHEAIAAARGRLWVGLPSEADNFAKLSVLLNTCGDKNLDAVTVEDIDRVIDGLMERGRTDATVNRYLSSISVFLQWCIDRNYRSKPVPKLDWREESEGRIRWLSYDEEALMLKHSRGIIPKIIEAGISTGLRCSEILKLPEKGDIAPNWLHLWKTKNNSPRSIPLTDNTYRTLRYILDHGLPSYSHLRYEWDRAAKLAGLDHDDEFVFHACRHTYATRLVEANINLRVIQRLMGHKRIETTMRYAHVHDGMLADAALAAQTFHDSRRSVNRCTYATQKSGVVLEWDTAKRAHLGQTGRLGEQPKRIAGVAELVDAPDLGSATNEDPDEGFPLN